MRLLFLFFGTVSIGCLIFVIGVWHLQPFLTRRFVLRRLSKSRQKIKHEIKHGFKRDVANSHEIDQLTELSELLDTTARGLRLGKSLASSLQSATSTAACKVSVIIELVTATSRGESFSSATKKLLSPTTSSELAFTLRTLELAATGGVGGVLALERSAIVLRERSTNIFDRRAQAAQAMLSTKVLSWAPVAVCGWLLVTSSAVRQFLIFSATGWLCVLLGCGFNYAGRRWMQAIVSPTPT